MDDATRPSDDATKLQHAKTGGSPVPLAVDLDGTLIRTDSLIESILALFKANPLSLFLFFVWLARGKAYLKQQVARRVTLDISSLPFNLNVLNFLRKECQANRPLILVTGADEHIARQIADYLHIFTRTIASNGEINMTGVEKKDRLIAEFGVAGFDYLGNDSKDLVVWQVARHSLVVGSRCFIDQSRTQVTGIERVFEVEQGGWTAWNDALRLYQWLKNMLVFVPLVAAHRFLETDVLFAAGVAFLSFGLCASSVYLLNDLLDLPEDRRHPQKRFRPFASGLLPLSSGLMAVPLLLATSIVIGLTLPREFLVLLGIYYATTLAYSLRLKNVVILDVLVLAGLFTMRMLAGSAAVEIWPSFWLLAHSMFLFISLALVKRYAELVTMRIAHGRAAKARNYVVSDSELLAAMGVASAFVSALVLVLYISSGSAQLLYGHLNVIWLACPALLYWLCYIWLIAHRGGMHDDPLIFALKDRVSRNILISIGIIMILAI